MCQLFNWKISSLAAKHHHVCLDYNLKPRIPPVWVIAFVFSPIIIFSFTYFLKKWKGVHVVVSFIFFLYFLKLQLLVFNCFVMPICSMWWSCWRVQYRLLLVGLSSQQPMANWFPLVALTLVPIRNWVLQFLQFLRLNCQCRSHASSSNSMTPRQVISQPLESL